MFRSKKQFSIILFKRLAFSNRYEIKRNNEAKRETTENTEGAGSRFVDDSDFENALDWVTENANGEAIMRS